MSEQLTDQARQIAEKIILANSSELGILGSGKAYKQLWARDSMICGFGLWLCENPEGGQIHQRSLKTLRDFQSPLGKIPHNVGYNDVDDPALVALGGRLSINGEAKRLVADTTHAGCVDSNLWYIMGHYYHYTAGGDLDFLRQAWQSLEKTLLWLRFQDSNECGLLEVHEAMDWADLFSNHYNVLFDNALYYAVWKAMGQMAAALGLPSESYFTTAEDVRVKVNRLLWVGPEEPKDWTWIRKNRQEWLYPLQRVETELVIRPYYLPYMGFRDYTDRFDTFGNLLAILFGVADQQKSNLILDYIHNCGINEPFPIRSVYPVVNPGEKEWRDYFRVRNLNQPNHYHNGGAWPFIGGFYVAALVQAGRMEEAKTQLDKLAQMNKLGVRNEWEFNEWVHGTSGRPMGYAEQSWSAAMYIFAHDAVANGAVRGFNLNTDWQLAAR
jgi:glycogen debranching enzyme